MCDKLNQLGKKITRYARLSSSISDQLTVDRFKQLIAEMEAEKPALHRAKEVRPPQLCVAHTAANTDI